ncbi:hypothetical protein [Nocardia sp. 852002-20019_SCH5090214]|uniref:hypothetical protein n=1 Tax=Nocardia sp. 852002-20019_SCH5090214 TaxID=1834087 RepID=UPI000B1EF4C7|nr:hypothetical protein [Nocardia sp. 852002-20019_SCH5090214]
MPPKVFRSAEKSSSGPILSVPGSILEAAEEGSRLDELRAMRRRLARALDDPQTPARDLAALSRRQLEIGKEIELIELAQDEDQSVVVDSPDEVFDPGAI